MDAKTNLLVIKGMISDESAETKAQVELAANEIREIVKRHGKAGVLGLTLIAAMLDAARES